MKERRAIIWIRPDQTEMIRKTAVKACLKIVAAGSGKTGQSSGVARDLEADSAIDDMRQALAEVPADLILLGDISGIDPPVITYLRKLQNQGIKVFSLEPLPGTLMEMTEIEERGAAELLPMMRHSPGFIAAESLLESFGEIRCVNISFRAGTGEGSLAARLFSAFDIIERLCGTPETIDAVLVGNTGSIPEKLPGINGHLTANLRYADNQAACIAVSDQAGKWSRGVTILGEGGCLRVDDIAAEWIGLDGNIVDEAVTTEISDLSDLLAKHVDRALNTTSTVIPPPRHATILALCEAALLSARTGQNESPLKMLKMVAGS